MMELFLAFLGFFSLILIVVLLLKDKVTPAISFIIVSGTAGILMVLLDIWLNAGIGQILKDNFKIKYFANMEQAVFDFKALTFFIKQGITSVTATGILFVFAILFFGVLGAAGVFNTIINRLLKTTGSNVYGICILTVIVSVIAHLDGSGASSFLIAIPALLPIYERLGMQKTTLMTIIAISLGIMNLLPWGGPTLRAATIIGAEANDIWFKLIPIQVVGLVCAIGVALYLARVEIARGAGTNAMVGDDIGHEIAKGEHQRDDRFILNVLLLVGVIVLLVVNLVPSYFCFMLGLCLAIFINYPQLSLAQKIMDSHSKSAMLMATTLFGAGILIGVFDKSGIMRVMAATILDILPHWAVVAIPLLVAITAVPMALIFCTDSYFFGVMPIVVGITNELGVDPMSIAIIMVVARNCAAFISPVVPATLLGCGLAGLNIRHHITHSFFWTWAVSGICLAAGWILGLIHFF